MDNIPIPINTTSSDPTIEEDDSDDDADAWMTDLANELGNLLVDYDSDDSDFSDKGYEEEPAPSDSEDEQGLFNGQGKKTYSNGDVYEGEFKFILPEGQGKKTYSNGDVYEGEFKNGVPEGQGKQTFLGGDVYEGAFKNGYREGQGKYTFANGDVYYEGEWKNDDPEGETNPRRSSVCDSCTISATSTIKLRFQSVSVGVLLEAKYSIILYH